MSKLIQRLQSGYYYVEIKIPTIRPRQPDTDSHSSAYDQYFIDLKEYVDSLKIYENLREEKTIKDIEFWSDLEEEYDSAGFTDMEKKRIKESIIVVKIPGMEQYRVWYKLYTNIVGLLTRRK